MVARCKGKDGQYFPAEQKLVFCSPSDKVSMRQKGTLLHELAHAWDYHMLTDEQRSAFMELRGVDTWHSHQVEWHERGAEHFAEIIKWGIIDEPIWIVTSLTPTPKASRPATNSSPAASHPTSSSKIAPEPIEGAGR